MPQPLVSVIVPTYNSAACIARCLQSITHQTYAEIELILVDNHSTDNTLTIAQQYTPNVYSCGPERSAQRNFGVGQSHGEYVLIIDSDMELSPNVVMTCVETIQANPSLKALVIPEVSFGEGFWAKCKTLERSFYPGVEWQEAARFFSAQVYRDLGGYDESLTGPEDYDLPNRLEHQSGKDCLGRISDLTYHNEGNLRLFHLLRKKFYYAATLDRYRQKGANQKRLRQQTSLVRRYALFLSQPAKLLEDPAVGIGMLYMKTCEFCAGVAGYGLAMLRST